MTTTAPIAIVIAEDGKLTLIEWEHFDQDKELDLMRAAVGGGWVQLLHLAQDLDLWVDEEGGLRGLCRNPVATRYATAKRTLACPLLGKAIITGGVDPQGRTRPLPVAQAIEVLSDLASAGGVITSKIHASSLLATAEH